jgi:hypothetical protein
MNLELEPNDGEGRRKYHLHHWLTDEIGHPELQKPILSVSTLMRPNTSWDQIYRTMQYELPKQNSNRELNLTDTGGEPL